MFKTTPGKIQQQANVRPASKGLFLFFSLGNLRNLWTTWPFALCLQHVNKNGHRHSGRSGNLVAHTGLEPVISALRGQRVNQLHQCAASELDYSGQ